MNKKLELRLGAVETVQKVGVINKESIIENTFGYYDCNKECNSCKMYSQVFNRDYCLDVDVYNRFMKYQKNKNIDYFEEKPQSKEFNHKKDVFYML